MSKLLPCLLLMLSSCRPPRGASEPSPAEPCLRADPLHQDLCRIATPPPSDLDAALARCDALSTTRVRDACRVSLAQAHTEPFGRTADWLGLGERICGPVRSQRWRDDCWFMVLDDGPDDIDPKSWLQACLRFTGAYAGDCVVHGVDRWLVGLSGAPAERWFGGSTLPTQLEAMDGVWRDAAARNSAPPELLSWERGNLTLVAFRDMLCEEEPAACDPRRPAAAPHAHPPWLNGRLRSGQLSWRGEDTTPWW